jgi:hypothetical protein
MTDELTCPGCWATDLDAEEMCQHRDPLCFRCCVGGEHDWLPKGAA